MASKNKPDVTINLGKQPEDRREMPKEQQDPSNLPLRNHSDERFAEYAEGNYGDPHLFAHGDPYYPYYPNDGFYDSNGVPFPYYPPFNPYYEEVSYDSPANKQTIESRSISCQTKEIVTIKPPAKICKRLKNRFPKSNRADKMVQNIFTRIDSLLGNHNVTVVINNNEDRASNEGNIAQNKNKVYMSISTQTKSSACASISTQTETMKMKAKASQTSMKWMVDQFKELSMKQTNLMNKIDSERGIDEEIRSVAEKKDCKLGVNEIGFGGYNEEVNRAKEINDSRWKTSDMGIELGGIEEDNRMAEDKDCKWGNCKDTKVPRISSQNDVMNIISEEDGIVDISPQASSIVNSSPSNEHENSSIDESENATNTDSSSSETEVSDETQSETESLNNLCTIENECLAMSNRESARPFVIEMKQEDILGTPNFANNDNTSNMEMSRGVRNLDINNHSSGSQPLHNADFNTVRNTENEVKKPTENNHSHNSLSSYRNSIDQIFDATTNNETADTYGTTHQTFPPHNSESYCKHNQPMNTYNQGNPQQLVPYSSSQRNSPVQEPNPGLQSICHYYQHSFSEETNTYPNSKSHDVGKFLSNTSAHPSHHVQINFSAHNDQSGEYSNTNYEKPNSNFQPSNYQNVIPPYSRSFETSSGNSQAFAQSQNASSTENSKVYLNSSSYAVEKPSSYTSVPASPSEHVQMYYPAYNDQPKGFDPVYAKEQTPTFQPKNYQNVSQQYNSSFEGSTSNLQIGAQNQSESSTGRYDPPSFSSRKPTNRRKNRLSSLRYPTLPENYFDKKFP